MKIKLQFIIASFIALAIYTPAAYGQANLVFSGGSGSPMSITLQQSVTYTINNTLCAGNFSSPLFVFDEAGDAFSSNGRNVTGTITFSINGGAQQSIHTADSRCYLAVR